MQPIKQFVCGRSKAILSVFLLTLSTYSFPMEVDSPSHASAEVKPLHLKNNKKVNRWSGKTEEELNAVFEAAPWKAQEIVDHLQDPDALSEPEYRAILIVGGPGCGKTTTAIAIPYRAGWEYNFIRSSELQRSHRNRATEMLLSELYGVKKSIKENGEKVVVIVDEFNKLLEHANDPQYDTDASSGAIQGFLDDMEGEDNFFFIGTMNDDTKMPDSMKNRIELDRVVFPPITDHILRRKIFCSKFVTPRMQLHEECDDEFIDSILELIKDCPPRSYKNMRKETSRLLHHEEPDSTLRFIKKEHLTKVAKELIQSRKEIKIGIEEETLAQRQERLHKESLKEQRRQHEESLEAQEYLARCQRNTESGIRSGRAGIAMAEAIYGEKCPEWFHSANDAGCTIQ